MRPRWVRGAAERSRRSSSEGEASAASIEKLLHQLAHDLRVRRALRLFHGLPHEVSEQALLPGTILAGLLRVRGDDPFTERTQRALVGHDTHPARLDDLPR